MVQPNAKVLDLFGSAFFETLPMWLNSLGSLLPDQPPHDHVTNRGGTHWYAGFEDSLFKGFAGVVTH